MLDNSNLMLPNLNDSSSTCSDWCNSNGAYIRMVQFRLCTNSDGAPFAELIMVWSYSCWTKIIWSYTYVNAVKSDINANSGLVRILMFMLHTRLVSKNSEPMISKDMFSWCKRNQCWRNRCKFWLEVLKCNFWSCKKNVWSDHVIFGSIQSDGVHWCCSSWSKFLWYQI